MNWIGDYGLEALALELEGVELGGRLSALRRVAHNIL